MHPSEAQWLLATNNNNELLLSQDLGTTWKSVANRVYDFAWGRSAGEGWDKDSIVAALLEEVTTDKKKCGQMGKTAYLCMRVLEMTSYGLRVKLADRLHNCSDLKNMSQKFRDNYIPQTQEIIRTLETQRRLTKTHKYLLGKIKLALKKAA